MAHPSNRHHYDDHFIRKFVGPMMGLPPDASHEVIKVRAGGGRVGTKRAIPPALRARLESKWQAVLAGPTGCATYEELCARVRKERDQREYGMKL